LSYERRCVASLRHLEPVLRQPPNSMVDALLRPSPAPRRCRVSGLRVPPGTFFGTPCATGYVCRRRHR